MTSTAMYSFVPQSQGSLWEWRGLSEFVTRQAATRMNKSIAWTGMSFAIQVCQADATTVIVRVCAFATDRLEELVNHPVWFL